jgi:hypothetical protein
MATPPRRAPKIYIANTLRRRRPPTDGYNRANRTTEATATKNENRPTKKKRRRTDVSPKSSQFFQIFKIPTRTNAKQKVRIFFLSFFRSLQLFSSRNTDFLLPF